MTNQSSKKKTFDYSDLSRYIDDEMKRTGKTKEQILEETFHDGFIIVSETDGTFKIESAQLYATPSRKTTDIEECIRLREKFAPIASCVNYIKDALLGGGVDVTIDDATDKYQLELKDELKKFIKNVYQDDYTRSLDEILNIMIDEAITVGFSAAEIVYNGEDGKGVNFFDYAKPVESQVEVKEKDKFLTKTVINYEITKPKDWTKLNGISRLKIINNAVNRLKLIRDAGWEASYWALDASIPQGTNELDEKTLIAKSLRKAAESPNAVKATFYHPWQIFALYLSRNKWEGASSMILPVLNVSLLLEKILNAVGEGIYRAGNKKYFLICGTEKRPWSAVAIRNLLSLLKDASAANWTTIPVPQGFDVKEIGGEVFEVQNVVQYFLRTIAGGMHVPPSVVGLIARGPETQHYSYQRMRACLKNAVEHQLFRLHLWSKFGAEKTKQGGSTEPLYIPEMRIKTEGLLNDVDRLKMDISILNVANPVRSLLKLEVERDIARLMGWDVIFPTQKEESEEIERAKKQIEQEVKMKEARIIGEKEQGEPQPQTEERQLKRLEGGVGVRKVGSKKGIARPMGETRMPQPLVEEVAETEEKEIIEETKPQKLEITVKAESQPQIIKVEQSKLHEIFDKMAVDYVEKQNEIAKIQKEIEDYKLKLLEKEKILKEEENKRQAQKMEMEVKNIQTEIERKEAEIKKLEKEAKIAEAEMEQVKMEIEKTKTEAEEIKKTHERKRKVMEKIEEDLKGIEQNDNNL